jgi:putative ABC transport system substrate-binding protein
MDASKSTANVRARPSAAVGAIRLLLTLRMSVAVLWERQGWRPVPLAGIRVPFNSGRPSVEWRPEGTAMATPGQSRIKRKLAAILPTGMNRREFIALLGGVAAAWPLAAHAAQRSKMPRIGIIDDAPIWDYFRRALRDVGYVEGETIAFEYRTAQGEPPRLAEAATDLARLPVDVIAVFGTPASRAAKAATTAIPIVAISIGDPVRAGLVASLALPGGNVTGNTILGPDLSPKRLQLLQEIIPSVSRVAFLWNPDNASNVAILEELQGAVLKLNMKLISVPVRSVSDFDTALPAMAQQRPDAMLMTNDPFQQLHITRIIEFLANNHIPGMFQTRENVIAGGFLSYGASLPDLFRRGGFYVHKILQGTRPTDLPVEQPVTFELVINLKTGRALGLEVSPSILARADEVIE